MPRRTSGRAGRTPNPVRTPRPRSSSHAAPPLPVSRVPEAGERRQALRPCPADPTLSVGYSCTSRVMGSRLADFCTAILTQARTSRGERKQRGTGRARRHGAVSGAPTRLHQSCRPTGPWRKGWARGVRPDQLPPAFLPFSQPVGSPLGGEAFPQLPSGPNKLLRGMGHPEVAVGMWVGNIAGVAVGREHLEAVVRLRVAPHGSNSSHQRPPVTVTP